MSLPSTVSAKSSPAVHPPCIRRTRIYTPCTLCASAVHRFGTIEPLFRSRGGNRHGLLRYADSKLALVMFTMSLAERLCPREITANCLHPGIVATNITGATNAFLRWGLKTIRPFVYGAEQAARSSLYAALDPALIGTTGLYLSPRNRQQDPSARARDPEARAALWAWSEKACGLKAMEQLR